YEPFWACAASLGVPVTVHEGISDWVPTLGRDRFDNPAMLHVVSHPFEQMAACAGLVLSGLGGRMAPPLAPPARRALGDVGASPPCAPHEALRVLPPAVRHLDRTR